MTRSIRLPKPPDEVVIATICSLNRDHIQQVDTVWNDILRATQQPDAYWDWTYKFRLSLNEDRYEAWAIELDEVLQGIVLLETQWHRSWLPGRHRLVYVEYLASAPWNRRPLEDPPYLKNVGRSLLVFTRQRSVELGYEGRVGLHSMPGAEGFYERFNMINSGPDPDRDDLIYFEYPAIRTW